MTILDRVGGTTRIRIDAAQLADELAKRVPADVAKRLPEDVDPVAWASSTMSDLRRDLGKAGSDLNLDTRLDELVQRIRQVVSAPGLRVLVARLERDLPDTDSDRYERAYRRGRVQARSIYLGLGLAAGVTAGIVAALLLDPKHGKERRDLITNRTSGFTQGVSGQVSGRTRAVTERVCTVAAERGLIKAEPPGALAEEAPVDEAPAGEAPAVPLEEAVAAVEEPRTEGAPGAPSAGA
jgi:hypothetical protein